MTEDLSCTKIFDLENLPYDDGFSCELFFDNSKQECVIVIRKSEGTSVEESKENLLKLLKTDVQAENSLPTFDESETSGQEFFDDEHQKRIIIVSQETSEEDPKPSSEAVNEVTVSPENENTEEISTKEVETLADELKGGDDEDEKYAEGVQDLDDVIELDVWQSKDSDDEMQDEEPEPERVKPETPKAEPTESEKSKSEIDGADIKVKTESIEQSDSKSEIEASERRDLKSEDVVTVTKEKGDTNLPSFDVSLITSDHYFTFQLDPSTDEVVVLIPLGRQGKKTTPEKISKLYLDYLKKPRKPKDQLPVFCRDRQEFTEYFDKDQNCRIFLQTKRFEAKADELPVFDLSSLPDKPYNCNQFYDAKKDEIVIVIRPSKPGQKGGTKRDILGNLDSQPIKEKMARFTWKQHPTHEETVYFHPVSQKKVVVFGEPLQECDFFDNMPDNAWASIFRDENREKSFVLVISKKRWPLLKLKKKAVLIKMLASQLHNENELKPYRPLNFDCPRQSFLSPKFRKLVVFLDFPPFGMPPSKSIHMRLGERVAQSPAADPKPVSAEPMIDHQTLEPFDLNKLPRCNFISIPFFDRESQVRIIVVKPVSDGRKSVGMPQFIQVRRNNAKKAPAFYRQKWEAESHREYFDKFFNTRIFIVQESSSDFPVPGTGKSHEGIGHSPVVASGGLPSSQGRLPIQQRLGIKTQPAENNPLFEGLGEQDQSPHGKYQRLPEQQKPPRGFQTRWDNDVPKPAFVPSPSERRSASSFNSGSELPSASFQSSHHFGASRSESFSKPSRVMQAPAPLRRPMSDEPRMTDRNFSTSAFVQADHPSRLEEEIDNLMNRIVLFSMTKNSTPDYVIDSDRVKQIAIYVNKILATSLKFYHETHVCNFVTTVKRSDATFEIQNLSVRVKKCQSIQDHVNVANVVANEEDYKWSLYVYRTLESALNSFEQLQRNLSEVRAHQHRHEDITDPHSSLTPLGRLREPLPRGPRSPPEPPRLGAGYDDKGDANGGRGGRYDPDYEAYRDYSQGNQSKRSFDYPAPINNYDPKRRKYNRQEEIKPEEKYDRHFPQMTDPFRQSRF